MANKIAKLKNNAAVDEALLRIGTLKHQLTQLEAKAEEKILKVKAELASSGGILDNEIKELERQVLVYAEENKETLFGDAKTFKLSFGDVLMRVSESLEISEETLTLCKKYGHVNAVKIEEKLNKNVLKTFTDDQLKAVKAFREAKESFSYKLNEAAILARKSA